MRIRDENGVIGIAFANPYYPNLIFARPDGAPTELRLWIGYPNLIFARPDGAPTELEAGNARLLTVTAWRRQPDGSLRGVWYDSPYGGLVTAHII